MTTDGTVAGSPQLPGTAAAATVGGPPAELRFGSIRFPLVAEPGQHLSLGRRSETRTDVPDIDLADLPNGRTVSRRHASLFHRDGEWLLRVETGALNPTEVDGESIPPGLEVPLDHGQTLTVAAVSLDFYQPQTAVQLVDDDQIQLDLAPTELRVEPGAAVTTGVRIINFTDHVDQFIVEVRGLPPTWYSLAYQGTLARRAEIGLFQTQSRIAPASDAQARLQILFNPPRECHSSTGQHTFTVRVTTRSSPRQRREVSGTLVILPFQGVELDRGTAHAHAASGQYAWQVRNTGNASTSIDLAATPADVTGKGMFARMPSRFRGLVNEPDEPGLDFSWESPSLSLDACEAEPARLEVSVRRRHWLGDTLQYHFAVSATSGAAVATAESYIECAPRISSALQTIGRWIANRLPFLVVVGVVATLAWTFFQPPEVIDFRADTTDIVAGQRVTFTMTVRHAIFFTILNSNYPGNNVDFLDQLKQTTDEWQETPNETTQYILQANNAFGFTKTNDQVVEVHPRPSVAAFTAVPATLVREGDPVQLDWKIQTAPDRRVAVQLVAVAANGATRDLSNGSIMDQLVDHPTDAETVYQLTVTDELGNSETAKQRVTISPPQLTSFTASSASIGQGSPVTLAWMGSGYTSLTLRAGAAEDDESQPEQPIDTRVSQLTELPDANTWYTLTATNAAGSVSRSLQVLVTPSGVAPPKLDFLLASPVMISQGDTTTISFSAQNADSVLLRDAQGRTILQQDTSGSPSVMRSIDIVPDRSTAYALTLTNAGGQLTQAVSVQVIVPTPTPEPSVTPAPSDTPPAG